MVAAAQPPVRLRPYQVDAIADLRRAIAAGHRSVLLVAPCGGGKTVIAAEIVRAAAAKQRRTLFLAHRRELIDQTVDKLTRFGVHAGVIMGQDARRDDWQLAQVCSVPTLARRQDRLPPGELIIVDEAHHVGAASYDQLLKAYPRAIVIGLTATPWRTDKWGLADLFTAHVVSTTTADLIEQGFLVPYDAFAYDSPKLHKVPLRAGDYRAKELEIACNTAVLVGSIVREYTTHAYGRRGVVFAVSIAHSRAVVDEFKAAGITAVHVDCKMSIADRRAALAGFASGVYTIVSSVGVLSEGWDCPVAEVAILARPTQSYTLFVQQLGRVLRPAPGKTRALVHDHSGCLFRHGFVEDLRIADYSPLATPDSVVELHTCPLCHAVFTTVKDGCCPTCGEAIKPVAAPKDKRGGFGRETLLVDGVRIDAAMIRRFREKRLGMGLERALSDREIARVAAATRTEKAAEYLRLQRVAAKRGFKPGFVSHQFRECFQHWPKFTAEDLAGVEAAKKPFLPLPRRDRDA